MRHDWIFDVLSDLKAYALANGMVALAAKAEEALAVARAEVARSGDGREGDAGQGESGSDPGHGGPSRC